MKLFTNWTKAILLGVSLSAGSLRAQMITFDELPAQPAHGVSLNGITFLYSGVIPAIFGDPNGPSMSMAHVNKPWLTGGAAGTLGFLFDQSISSLKFGYALNTYPGGSVPIAMAVSLLRSDYSLISTQLYGVSTVQWSAEGLYEESYNSPVAAVILNFNSQFTHYGFDPLFGIDNISYTTFPAPSSPVPEPSTYGIIGVVGLLIVIGLRKRRHAAQRRAC